MSVEPEASVELEIPVIGQLLRRPLKSGKLLLFLFDPDSLWPALLLNIVAELLQKGTDVLYVVTSRRLTDIRDDLKRRGVDAAKFEGKENLVLSDGYTLKTGRPSQERYSLPSMNVADLSILSSKALDEWPTGSVRIFENVSEIAEASDEKTFLKFYRTWTSRLVSNGRFVLDGFVRGIHSDSLYHSVMANADGVFELKTEEFDGKLESVLRARSYKGGPVDTSKYILRIDENLRVALQAVTKGAQ